MYTSIKLLKNKFNTCYLKNTEQWVIVYTVCVESLICFQAPLAVKGGKESIKRQDLF